MKFFSLDSIITYAELRQPTLNGHELIFLSRYYLGKCYAEQGEVEKARNQYNIVFNGTQNNALKDIVALARV